MNENGLYICVTPPCTVQTAHVKTHFDGGAERKNISQEQNPCDYLLLRNNKHYG